jgi:hypothetical protein
MSEKNHAEKYGATSMFGSPGSSSAIDTLFHHIPDIKKPNQCPVCKCDPLIEYIHYLDILAVMPEDVHALIKEYHHLSL